MVYSKVKAGFWTGMIVAIIVTIFTQLGYELDPQAVAFVTAIVSTILAWLKVEKVGYVKS